MNSDFPVCTTGWRKPPFTELENALVSPDNVLAAPPEIQASAKMGGVTGVVQGKQGAWENAMDLGYLSIQVL